VSDRYPCPCCGHRLLGEMPGSYEICPVCFWEDDGVQFRWPTMVSQGPASGSASPSSFARNRRISTSAVIKPNAMLSAWSRVSERPPGFACTARDSASS